MTHVFITTWLRQQRRENVKINDDAMMRNLLDELRKPIQCGMSLS